MPQIHFLNVDLDLRARSGLADLLAAFGAAVVILNQEDENFASVEIADQQPQSADAAIAAFCRLVHELPPDARAIWDSCELRSMNIGIQAGTAPPSESFRLSDETLAMLTAIKAEIALTVYAAKPGPVDADGNPIETGDKVFYKAAPRALLHGLPEEDQEAIKAQENIPMAILGFDVLGRAEFEFTAADGGMHTIWVAPGELFKAGK